MTNTQSMTNDNSSVSDASIQDGISIIKKLGSFFHGKIWYNICIQVGARVPWWLSQIRFSIQKWSIFRQMFGTRLHFYCRIFLEQHQTEEQGTEPNVCYTKWTRGHCSLMHCEICVIIQLDVNSLLSVIISGRTFVRRLIDTTIWVKKPSHSVTLNDGTTADIKMWLTFFKFHNGKTIFIQPEAVFPFKYVQ